MSNSTDDHDRIPQPPGDIIEIVDENLRGGFAQVPRPVLRARGLSVKAKLVYIALLDYAWQSGSCFPGQQRLAEDLDVSVDSVQRALAELKGYRLVDWKRRGLNRPNIYYLLRLSDNPQLKLADSGNRSLRHPAPGNRNLRYQETAGLRYQETAAARHEEYSEEKDSEEKDSVDISKYKNEISRLAENSFQHQESRRSHASTPIADALAQVEVRQWSSGRGRPPKPTPAIEAYVLQFSAEFHDDEHARANVTQATRLYKASGLPEDAFIQRMFEARSITKQRGNIRKGASNQTPLKNRAPYFFVVLQDLLAGGAATSRQPQVAELQPAPLQHTSRDSRPKSLPAASSAGAQWPSAPVERPAGTPPRPRRIEATTLTTRTAWQMVLERLKETMSAANYGTWLSQSLLISCDRSKAIVGAPSGFIVEHLAKRFSNPIKKELSAVVGFHPQQIDYLTLSELGLLSPNGQHPESTSPS